MQLHRGGPADAQERQREKGHTYAHAACDLTYIGIVAVIGTALGNRRIRRFVIWFAVGWLIGDVVRDIRHGGCSNGNQSPLNGQ